MPSDAFLFFFFIFFSLVKLASISLFFLLFYSTQGYSTTRAFSLNSFLASLSLTPLAPEHFPDPDGPFLAYTTFPQRSPSAASRWQRRLSLSVTPFALFTLRSCNSHLFLCYAFIQAHHVFYRQLKHTLRPTLSAFIYNNKRDEQEVASNSKKQYEHKYFKNCKIRYLLQLNYKTIR